MSLAEKLAAKAAAQQGNTEGESKDSPSVVTPPPVADAITTLTVAKDAPIFQAEQDKDEPGSSRFKFNPADLVKSALPDLTKEAVTGTRSKNDGAANFPPKQVLIHVASPIRPVRKSDTEVLFKSARNALNFFYMPPGEHVEDRISFQNGYFLTDDSVLADYIKENYANLCSVEEEGPLCGTK